MDTLEIAEKVENLLHDKFSENHSDPFEIPYAQMYGVNVSISEGDDTPRLCFIASNPDIYDLLTTPTTAVGRMFDYVALVTTGWAAPLNDDGEVEGAPHSHPQRRRVRLIVCANREGMASVMRFGDTNEVATDAGKATGALAEAIAEYIA